MNKGKVLLATSALLLSAVYWQPAQEENLVALVVRPIAMSIPRIQIP